MNKYLNRINNNLTTTYLTAFLLNLIASVQLVNAQIVLDKTLVGSDKSTVTSDVIINGKPSDLISDGAVRGINLFHSFYKFNVSKNRGVYFDNPQGILNIIGRVTFLDPSNISNIMGTIGVRNSSGVLGKANLFLINPNGIVFSSDSSLDVGGSFIATTAHAIQFQNQGYFDTVEPNSPPLLNVNPSGFLFSRTNIAPIINSSQQSSGVNKYLNPSLNSLITDNLKGLRVPDKHSLILLGGSITVDNGGFNALGGRVEIGSVAGKGLVGLSVNNESLSLDFPSSIDRGDISFIQSSKIYTSGNNSGGGNVKIIGNNIQFKDGSQIISATTGKTNGGTLLIHAIDTIRLSNQAANGVFSTITYDLGAAGNIEISTSKLIIDQGAQINSSTQSNSSSTQSNGRGGDISINAVDLISLEGPGIGTGNSGIFSSTIGPGVGGNIIVNTLGDLILVGNASINSAGNSIRRGGVFISNSSGNSGNIKIAANNSIQINGGSFSARNSIGNAGKIEIDTKSFSIRNGGIIRVDSTRKQAGDITINSDSLSLDNGTITANTGISGANIKLNIFNVLSLENESLISASASNNADGGNIEIDTPIFLALPPTGSNGSDISATADKGRGGNITINTQGIFGITARKAFEGNQRIDNLSNDIDASSQFGQSGQVQINTTTDPNQGLVELPATVVDPSTLVAQNPCKRVSSSEFTRSGRGGLPPSLSQDLNGESIQVGLVEPADVSAEKPEPKSDSKQSSSVAQYSSQISPAQGWVYNSKGEVVLVAYNSAVTDSQRLQTAPAGCPVF